MQISALNSQKWPHAMPKTFATIILQYLPTQVQQKDAVKPQYAPIDVEYTYQL